MREEVLKTKYIVQTAVIAAVYAVFTLVLSPISYGPVQVRVSEALTVLPGFTPAAVPGLFIGCFISNMVGPYGVIDMICGSVATLIAAFFSHLLRARKQLIPLPPVVVNGIVVGCMLHYAYEIPGLLACIGWVALGQTVACCGIGLPLMRLMERYKDIF